MHEFLKEVFFVRLDVRKFNEKDVFALLCLVNDLLMISPHVFSGEAVEEVLEGVLEVGIGAFNEVGLFWIEVLV